MKQGIEPKNNLKEILNWILAILIAVVIAQTIRGFIMEHVKVDGSSMLDTLEDKQVLVMYKLGYHFSMPKRGDIVVVVRQEGMLKGFYKYLIPMPNPGEVDYIKRVIALPGDEIDIKNDGYVYINSEKLDEPYAKGLTRRNGMDFPIKIKENEFFVMGDNREHSTDSRMFGAVKCDKIKGKAVFRLLPFSKFGSL